jgi:BTB/POZ domain
MKTSPNLLRTTTIPSSKRKEVDNSEKNMKNKQKRKEKYEGEDVKEDEKQKERQNPGVAYYFGIYSDFIIHCEKTNTHYHTHKLVLRKHSEVFADILATKAKKQNNGVCHFCGGREADYCWTLGRNEFDSCLYQQTLELFLIQLYYPNLSPYIPWIHIDLKFTLCEDSNYFEIPSFYNDETLNVNIVDPEIIPFQKAKCMKSNKGRHVYRYDIVRLLHHFKCSAFLKRVEIISIESLKTLTNLYSILRFFSQNEEYLQTESVRAALIKILQSTQWDISKYESFLHLEENVRDVTKCVVEPFRNAFVEAQTKQQSVSSEEKVSGLDSLPSSFDEDSNLLLRTSIYFGALPDFIIHFHNVDFYTHRILLHKHSQFFVRLFEEKYEGCECDFAHKSAVSFCVDYTHTLGHIHANEFYLFLMHLYHPQEFGAYTPFFNSSNSAIKFVNGCVIPASFEKNNSIEENITITDIPPFVQHQFKKKECIHSNENDLMICFEILHLFNYFECMGFLNQAQEIFSYYLKQYSFSLETILKLFALNEQYNRSDQTLEKIIIQKILSNVWNLITYEHVLSLFPSETQTVIRTKLRGDALPLRLFPHVGSSSSISAEFIN